MLHISSHYGHHVLFENPSNSLEDKVRTSKMQTDNVKAKCHPKNLKIIMGVVLCSNQDEFSPVRSCTHMPVMCVVIE